MLTKLMGLAGGLALLAALTLALTAIPARAAVDGPISEAMAKLFKGPKSAKAALKTAVNSEPPDWKAIQEQTKLFTVHGTKLAENAPPKGDANSFKALAEKLGENSKQLDDAAKKEDLTATKAALSKIDASCKACHSAHRP